jgi:IS4 transposase
MELGGLAFLRSGIMVLREVVERFEKRSAVTVMTRALMENVVAEAFLNEIFAEHARKQRPSDLSFATVVELMSETVCQMRPALHAAYQSHEPRVPVSIEATYGKVNRVEPQVSAALVRETARKLQAILDELPLTLEPLIPGYRVKMVDGSHLAATEHRLAELRTTASGPLPGQALVVIDPTSRLVLDVFPCADAHTSERLLLIDLVETIATGDLWIGDRNFCTSMFLWEIALNRAFFLIRQHATNVRCELPGERRQIGRVETGLVYEQEVLLHDGCDSEPLAARRVTVELDKPTGGGEPAVHILTNLPASVDALTVARAYRKRWTIENVLWELEANLESEIDTLAYPSAALLGFCVALMTYNVLRMVQWALAAEHGQEKIEQEFSSYYLADELRATWTGMTIALPEDYWHTEYAHLGAVEMARRLRKLACLVELRRFRKHKRGPKKPAPKRTSANGKPHIAIARVLEQRKATVP